MEVQHALEVLDQIACAVDGDELDRVITTNPWVLSREIAGWLEGDPSALADGDDPDFSTLRDIVSRRLHLYVEQGAALAVQTVPPPILGLHGHLPDRIREVALAAYAADPADAVDLWRSVQDHDEWPLLAAPVRFALLGDSCAALLSSYAREGNRASLLEAIEICERLLADSEQHHASRPNWLGTLSAAVLDRYELEGSPADLERAVLLAEEAVAAREQAEFLHSLSAALLRRGETGGNLSDLDDAVVAARRALALAGDGGSLVAICIEALGRALHRRYEQSGNLVDLQEAIDAMSSSPGIDTGDITSHNNLGMALLTLFERTREPEIIDQAVSALQRAVASTPENSVHRPGHLSNLSAALSYRYALAGDITDLIAAFEASQEAVDRCPLDAVDRVDYLINLGSSLLDLDTLVPLESTAVDEAVDHLQTAVDSSAEDSTQRALALYTLGRGYVRQYRQTNDLQRRVLALLAYRDACSIGLMVRPEVALIAARAWSQIAIEDQTWEEVIIATKQGIDASKLLISRQLLRRHTAAFLDAIGSLHAHSAFALGMTKRDIEAVLTLESGRAVLLSAQLERAREDLNSLPALGFGELLDRYREMTARLAALEGDHESTARRAPYDPARADTLRTSRREFDALIAEIRAIPGYDDFMAEPTLEDILEAAIEPLVYLLHTPAGGAAFIIVGGEHPALHPIGLPLITDRTVRDQLDRYFTAYDARATAPDAWEATLAHVTRELWDNGIGRVMECLADDLRVEHAVLIPTGLLGLLPLHAVWTDSNDSGSDRESARGSMCMSYAPNAQSLRSVRTRGESNAFPHLLVVGAAGTAERELREVEGEIEAAASHFDDPRVLVGAEATSINVLRELSDATVLHVAAHGRANLTDPLDSAIELHHGEYLTVRRLRGVQRAPNSGRRLRLAILSACETGVVGARTPDEVLGFAAGFLEVGTAGVIASMWAVEDDATRALMTLFYEAWLGEGQHPAMALHAAQQRLRVATNSDLCQWISGFGRRCPQGSRTAERIWQGARPFSAMHHWAAFSYTGT